MVHPPRVAVHLLYYGLISRTAVGQVVADGLGDEGEDLDVPVHLVAQRRHPEGVDLAHLLSR